MDGHELWEVSNALFVVILMVLLGIALLVGGRGMMDIRRIKEDWPNQRCTPLIMPFASWFGVNAKENFEFCMGKIFSGHSQSYLGSISSVFTKFTTLLQMIFQSMNSMRNTVATLGGGINVILKEFTERISMFFFRLRLSAIYMKSLFMRMYALLFSVMYMGMSGITGMTSFTNTFLFSFLDTFCFPGDTLLRVVREGSIQEVPIKEVRIDDRLYPSMDRVTALFQFHAMGQPMVRLGRILVSTNHYVYEGGKRIRAADHSDAVPAPAWESQEPLYCLNTDTHHIPMDGYLFMDYDEVPSADQETMRWVERHVNGLSSSSSLPSSSLPSSSLPSSSLPSSSTPPSYQEYGMAVHPTTSIRMASGSIQSAETLQLGDRLSTGGVIAGIIRKQVNETIRTEDGIQITPSTLYWDTPSSSWKRFGTLTPTLTPTPTPTLTPTFCSFIVLPHSQLELESGLRIRDYLEWCSPDTEAIYAEHLLS